MSDLDFLQGRIDGYADYANSDARHQVDKQIRAWLGEALTTARERVAPTGALGERLDGLLLRCQFPDQRVIRAADVARFDGGLTDRVHELDRAIVESADRLRAVAETAGLATALDDVTRLLDERFGALADAPSA